jgi:hypothetical protein
MDVVRGYASSGTSEPSGRKLKCQAIVIRVQPCDLNLCPAASSKVPATTEPNEMAAIEYEKASTPKSSELELPQVEEMITELANNDHFVNHDSSLVGHLSSVIVTPVLAVVQSPRCAPGGVDSFINSIEVQTHAGFC